MAKKKSLYESVNENAERKEKMKQEKALKDARKERIIDIAWKATLCLMTINSILMIAFSVSVFWMIK